jgi:hypothetical protein
VRARLVGLGLVLTLGFLLLVSLVISAGLAALGSWINTFFTSGKVVLMMLNTVISLMLLTIVFGAIFKLLPDQEIAWPEVAIGAVATAVLFTIFPDLAGSKKLLSARKGISAWSTSTTPSSGSRRGSIIDRRSFCAASRRPLCDAELGLELECRHAVRVGCHEMCGPEPYCQRQF